MMADSNRNGGRRRQAERPDVCTLRGGLRENPEGKVVTPGRGFWRSSKAEGKEEGLYPCRGLQRPRWLW